MVTKKTASLAATIAAPVPTEAPATTATAPATPARLPARKRATAAKPAIKKVPLKQATASTQPEKTADAPAPAPAEKTKKIKMVRDSFTMPKTEYATLDELKQRAILLGHPLKKSELLRIGIKLLAALPDARLLAALTRLPSLKSGQQALDN